MSEATIYDTRNSLSAVVSDLVSGREKEHIIKNRNVPVVKIVPIEPKTPTVHIGGAKNTRFIANDEALDAHNDEIAALFGA